MQHPAIDIATDGEGCRVAAFEGMLTENKTDFAAELKVEWIRDMYQFCLVDSTMGSI